MLQTRTIATVLLLSIALEARAADQWQPAEPPLTTRWSKDVSPDRVWPEYPRPQMVRGDWVNLNGLWDYAICPRADERPDEWDGKILVPFAVESALSGVKKPVTPGEQLWYRRTFNAHALPDRGRLLLHFGAVDWRCTVWVNGKQVGEHTGGYEPFTFDITEALNDKENELVVAVGDPTDSGTQPRGKQVLKPQGIWYTAVTGIWQTVWLEPVSSNHIKSLKIDSDVDRGVITVSVDATGGNTVRVFASDGEGENQAKSEGAVGESIEVKVANPKLWSPNSPHLYDLKAELVVDGQVVDTVDSYAGLRKIEVRKDADGINRLMLNNQVLFQYGPLDQGWWPDGLYTPASDEAMKYDIEMTKKFGMNMARKHVKCECDRWYYWCDKLGLLVWQDMPSGDTSRNDESRADYRRELKGMVDTLHNHPSIVVWVPFNEGWGQHDTPEVAAWLEEYDPTRPVNEASGWHDRGSGQISDMHSYPGPGMRPVEDERAIVLGEFGGLGMPVRGHTWQDEKNWGYVSYDAPDKLTDAYVALLLKIRPLIGQGLCAAVYTQTSDVEIEVNGLMTYDRELVKMDIDRMSAAAHKLYEAPPRVTTLVPTSEQQPQAWRYATSQPRPEWTQREFDDSTWSTGEGGFGTAGTPGAIIGTKWDGPEIWLRRTFEIKELPVGSQLALRVHHDEDIAIYLNGQEISRERGYTASYQLVPLDRKAAEALRIGQNSLSVHCSQTRGGQFIDVGLVLITEQPGRQAFSPALEQR